MKHIRKIILFVAFGISIVCIYNFGIELNKYVEADQVNPGFPRIHTSLTLTIRPETLGNIEFNCIVTCHPLHSVV